MLRQRTKMFSEMSYFIELHQKNFILADRYHDFHKTCHFHRRPNILTTPPIFVHNIFHAAIMCVLFNLIKINIGD